MGRCQVPKFSYTYTAIGDIFYIYLYQEKKGHGDIRRQGSFRKTFFFEKCDQGKGAENIDDRGREFFNPRAFQASDGILAYYGQA